jgi:pyrrolidone-carboxylate peptidase
MLMRSLLPALFAGLAAALAVGCAADAADEEAFLEDAVTVDTSTPLARAQYDANVDFARRYVPTCKPTSGRKRVLVTGFGRFLDISENATGRVVSTLLPAAKYPMTAPPPLGEVDPPGPQLSVAQGTVRLAQSGDVDVCAMIVPVYWDLAAILIAKEIDAFGPDLVLMNGVADSEQDLWIELGAVNRASETVDGSNRLRPVPTGGRAYIPLVPTASAGDTLKGTYLSYGAVKAGALAAIAKNAAVKDDDGRRFDEVLTGVKLAGFPRAGNTYLCNNVTYVVNYLMAYPSRTVGLLAASKPVPGKPNQVRIKIARDASRVPRAFMHWPSSLGGAHLVAAAEVMKAAIDAQLSSKDRPVVGTNAMAEIQATGGTF